MFRALVLLLILPTLLMPPGMCICQFVPIGEVPAAPTSLSHRHPSVGHAADPRPDCTCDSCRRSRTADTAPERKDDQPTRTPSGPGPGKHWPDCPAAVRDVPLNVAVPTVTVQADVVATISFLTPIVEAVASPDHAARVSPPVVSPPLFISHCALLI